MTEITFIGFGEAAQAFVTNWATGDLERTKGFDLKSNDPASNIAQTYQQRGVTECKTLADAAQGAGVIFSLVTADQTAEAANAAAQVIEPNALFLDCNSVSPGLKRANRDVIERSGGRYVDVAVMAPVHPALNKVSLLLYGPHAGPAADQLSALGMNAAQTDGDIGHASTIKMIKSIAVKGIESILAECASAAHAAGVDEIVFASLDKMFPHFDFSVRAGYHMERMFAHGQSRTAEMEEVAKTIEELGPAESYVIRQLDLARKGRKYAT